MITEPEAAVTFTLKSLVAGAGGYQIKVFKLFVRPKLFYVDHPLGWRSYCAL